MDTLSFFLRKFLNWGFLFEKSEARKAESVSMEQKTTDIGEKSELRDQCSKHANTFPMYFHQNLLSLKNAR